LSEVCGLGLIDRLWADRGVRAVFINGPDAVFVERNGLMEPSPEVFRDQAHLLDIASRLVHRPATGVAEFQLRDGGSGTVIFPPSAPNGPVVAIRRGEPGTATFERLIAADMLDRRLADLLRIAARCRLNVLVTGPSGAGTTSLLVAIARDLGSDARVVTVARHREFRWQAPGKVELVASPSGHGGAAAAGYPALLAAGLRLQPHLLILDSIGRDDEAALMERLSQGQRGILAAVRSDATTAVSLQSFDLVVRLARGRDGLFRAVSLEDASGAAVFVHDGGRFHRRTAQPAFAEIAAAAGYRDALASILR
jgi:pilus assembly protein CpaF